MNQRVLLMLVLAAMFAALGAFLLVLAGFLLAVVEARMSAFADRCWAYATGGGVILVAAYAVDSVLISWFTFRRLDGTWDWSIAGVLAACALGAVVATWHTAASSPRPGVPLRRGWL